MFIYYGPIANNRLLRLYGFVIPDNPNDNYELVLQTHAAAPFYEQKSILWELTGLDSTSTIPLTLTDPLPKKVLQYLRIQRLDEEEINAMAHRQKEKNYDMITKPNEIIVLKSLVESFSEILNSFGTQLEELEAQLASGVYSVGGNAWAAAHVSLGEQRVLRLARKRAKDMLTSVKSGSADTQRSLLGPTRCENCGNDSVPLMACGRCRAAMYCGRACQVAHYKEHKAHCPRGIPENGFHTN